MDLLTVVLVLVAVGVILGLITKFGAEWLDPTIARAIWWIIIIATVIWLLNVIGLLDYFRAVKMPKV